MTKILHTGDLHFSNKADKLAEVVRVTDFIADQAVADPPDVVILSGDTLDCHDGPIHLDSPAARAAISFVQRLADACPVLIVRGTKSHDRETPYIFRHLRSRHPIHVASEIEMVAVLSDFMTQEKRIVPLAEYNATTYVGWDTCGVFALVPSLDKSHFAAQCSGVADGNAKFRELVFDLFSGIGQMLDTVPAGVPRVLVTHGMVTGSVLSSGETAVGEDLEFGVNDLKAAKCHYTALGHVHKYQSFPGGIVYAGSPGRLNFGEQEEKGFCVVTLEGELGMSWITPALQWVKTPAREFALYSVEWSDAAAILAEAVRCEAECSGRDVRFRYTIPEENRHEIDRSDLERLFLAAGASRVKIECIIIPKQRTRAAGISRLVTLREKVEQWAVTTNTVVTPGVLSLAEKIEGLTADDLVTAARQRLADSGLSGIADEKRIAA